MFLQITKDRQANLSFAIETTMATSPFNKSFRQTRQNKCMSAELSVSDRMDKQTRSIISSEIIAGIALLVTIFGSAQGWLILPEKVRVTQEHANKLEQRINSMESLANERAETLARIDERTKRIEQIITQDHRSSQP